MSMQELDSRQRRYREKKKNYEKKLEEIKPSFNELVRATLQTVDLRERENIDPIASTPEDLVVQSRLLLETKGNMAKPTRGRMFVARPDEHEYLKLPFVKVKIGEKNVDIYLKESKGDYHFGIGLFVGDDYFESRESIVISTNRVEFMNGATLKAPEDLQKISRILTMVDKALPPKA